MNHFMLPRGSTENLLATSFGVHAMEMLINEMMKLGADRWNLEAKVFGGGHVLQVAETKENVPASNILFAQNFLKTERIKVLSTDVGGYAAREIFYYTYSGRVGLRRLEATGSGSKKLAEIREDSSPISVRVQSDDDILF